MQIETAVLRDCGHWAAGPTGLLDQSNARMRSPISPPPLKKLRSVESLGIYCYGEVVSRIGGWLIKRQPVNPVKSCVRSKGFSHAAAQRRNVCSFLAPLRRRVKLSLVRG